MIANIFGQAVQEGLPNACDSTSSYPVNMMESHTSEDKSFQTWKKTIGQPKQRGLSREGESGWNPQFGAGDCESRVLAVSAGGRLGFLAKGFTEGRLGGLQASQEGQRPRLEKKRDQNSSRDLGRGTACHFCQRPVLENNEFQFPLSSLPESSLGTKFQNKRGSLLAELESRTLLG